LVSFSNPPENSGSLDQHRSVALPGYAKNCRFAVRMSLPPRFFADRIGGGTAQAGLVHDLTYLCEAAEYAGRSFQTVDARYYGPAFKMPYQSVYNDMNLTFMCRNGMKEKKFFDYWHNQVNPNSSYDFEYRDNYCTDINIYAFDEAGVANYQQSLVKAWPLIVNPIQTTWADDQITRLNVTFTYQDYKTKDDPPPVPALSTLVLDSISLGIVGGPIGTYFLGQTGDRGSDV
jgi:hypothetical protein